MRIGIYSGSFDPIHTGHAMVASYVAQWGGVDEVWITVSRLNPLKQGSRPASDACRLEMARIVAGRCRNVRASDFELSLPLPSYTFVTLCRLQEEYPQHEFVLIIGSDNLENFSRWRNSEEILSRFGVIVYPRPGHPLPERLPEGAESIGEGAPLALISSSFVRNALKEGGDIRYFVPCEVADYIEKNNLYKD